MTYFTPPDSESRKTSAYWNLAKYFRFFQKIRNKEFSRLFRYWKLLSARKILYLPKILSSIEKRAILLLLVVVVFSGVSLFTRIYLRLTVPVPQVGKAYIEGMLREPRNVNPLYATTDGDRDIAKLVFSPLINYSGSGEPVPDLAENYEISKDGKIYTVNLRKDAFWHDGKPVTAEDVVFTIKTVQNPQHKSPLRANWQGVSVEEIDQYTVRFSLRTAYAPFLENLTLGIIPKHLWEKISPEQALLHELNLKPVGSGPYIFDQFKQGRDGSISWYRVKRNTNYFREGPYLRKITFLFYKSEEEMLAAYQRGQIEGFGPVTVGKVPELAPYAKVVQAAMPRLFGIFFNEKAAPLLAEKSVRRAIAHALDKKEITSSVISSGAIPVESVLPLGSAGHTSDKVIYPFDPEKSMKLLEEAGWKDINGDGIREKRVKVKGKEELEPLRLKLSTSDWPDLLRTAEIVRSSLSKVGIELVVERLSFSELESAVIRPRNFEMLLFGQAYGYEPDPFAFWHSSQLKDPGLNIASYSNRKADQALEEARRTPSLEDRKKKYGDLQEIIAQDLPAIPLYSQLYLYLLPGNMGGADISEISLPADRFNEIYKWFRETKRVLK